MLPATTSLALRPSFYGPAPESPRDDVLGDYLRFLERRNGPLVSDGIFSNRESWLDDAAGWRVRHRGDIDRTSFEQNYERFDPEGVTDAALLTLLAFVKVNASEAYGVEVITRKRYAHTASDVFGRVERVLTHEERYHTRILVGAAQQFSLPSPVGAWRPPLPLTLLIGTLAHAPKSIFHPILLGSEIAGVFTFHWMLTHVREQFRDQPALRETLEARLIEILVDEIGHIAFNRAAVGRAGLAAARAIAPHVAASTSIMMPEFRRLGWSRDTLHDFDRFDLDALPDEVRRRAFFV